MPANSNLIIIEVTLLEAALIKKLREYKFGSFTIHKIEGNPIRLEMGGSVMLEARAGSTLAIKR